LFTLTGESGLGRAPPDLAGPRSVGVCEWGDVMGDLSAAKLAAVAALTGLSLAACASVPSDHADRPGARNAHVQKGQKSTPGAAAQGLGGQALNGGKYKLGAPYEAGGMWYVPTEEPDYDQVGIASWYGDEFHGRATANGEQFDMHTASAAHTTLPLPSILEVTNLENGRKIRVRLNDRGPFKAGRLIDLSRGAAQELGFLEKGTAQVRVRYIGPAKLDGTTEPLYVARNDVQSQFQPAPIPAAASAPPPPSPASASSFQIASQELPPLAAAPAPRWTPPPYAPDPAPAPVPPPAEPTRVSAPVSTPVSAPPPPPPKSSPKPAALKPAAKPPAPKPAAPRPGQGFAVQAGAFSDRARAEKVAGDLAKAGAAAVRPVEVADRQLYRVVIGPWADRAEAQAAREQVASMGFADARVIQSF